MDDDILAHGASRGTRKNGVPPPLPPPLTPPPPLPLPPSPPLPLPPPPPCAPTTLLILLTSHARLRSTSGVSSVLSPGAGQSAESGLACTLFKGGRRGGRGGEEEGRKVCVCVVKLSGGENVCVRALMVMGSCSGFVFEHLSSKQHSKSTTHLNNLLTNARREYSCLPPDAR